MSHRGHIDYINPVLRDADRVSLYEYRNHALLMDEVVEELEEKIADLQERVDLYTKTGEQA